MCTWCKNCVQAPLGAPDFPRLHEGVCAVFFATMSPFWALSEVSLLSLDPALSLRRKKYQLPGGRYSRVFSTNIVGRTVVFFPSCHSHEFLHVTVSCGCASTRRSKMIMSQIYTQRCCKTFLTPLTVVIYLFSMPTVSVNKHSQFRPPTRPHINFTFDPLVRLRQNDPRYRGQK